MAGQLIPSFLAFGRNAAAPAFKGGAMPILKGMGEAGRGALNTLWSASKATGKGLYNYGLKPVGNTLANPRVQRGLLGMAGGALRLAGKGYALPYTAPKWIAKQFGASPGLARVIGGGTLASLYLGREAVRNDGKLDFSSPSTYGNMLLNPIRDAYSMASGGLGALFEGGDDSEGIASRREVGAADADAQRAAHAAQNAGATNTPDIIA